MNKYKGDCYFYERVQEMNATIPTCNYDKILGYCPCEECCLYISEKEADALIKNVVDERLKKRRGE